MSNHTAPPPQEGQSPLDNNNSSDSRLVQDLQSPWGSLRTHPCGEDVSTSILEVGKLRLWGFKCQSPAATCKGEGQSAVRATFTCYTCLVSGMTFSSPNQTPSEELVLKHFRRFNSPKLQCLSALQSLVWDFHFPHQNSSSRLLFFVIRKTIAFPKTPFRRPLLHVTGLLGTCNIPAINKINICYQGRGGE